MVKMLLFLMIYLFGNIPEEIITENDFLSLGVVDRIEGEIAVVLLEDEGRELELPTSLHTKEDSGLLIYWQNNQPIILGMLYSYEKESEEKLKNLREALQQKESTFP